MECHAHPHITPLCRETTASFDRSGSHPGTVVNIEDAQVVLPNRIDECPGKRSHPLGGRRARGSGHEGLPQAYPMRFCRRASSLCAAQEHGVVSLLHQASGNLEGHPTAAPHAAQGHDPDP